MNDLAQAPSYRELVNLGLRCLAGPFAPDEQWMLRNVLADMARGGIEHRVVTEWHGTYVWRSAKGWMDSEVVEWRHRKGATAA